MFDRNMGAADRVVRLLIGLVFFAFAVSGALGGVPTVVLALLAAAMLVTSAIGFCPTYALLKIDTRRDAERQRARKGGEAGRLTGDHAPSR